MGLLVLPCSRPLSCGLVEFVSFTRLSKLGWKVVVWMLKMMVRILVSQSGFRTLRANQKTMRLVLGHHRFLLPLLKSPILFQLFCKATHSHLFAFLHLQCILNCVLITINSVTFRYSSSDNS
ncbi:hypothetical protein YC2023_049626 [Brassica napus]|uniref:(rape) hypothetical protein n=1 Tax=Brassica napus TaxID=3708 RepID=A0A816JB69_BRANA|nr:unnamed protein product [Brassica napus]